MSDSTLKSGVAYKALLSQLSATRESVQRAFSEVRKRAKDSNSTAEELKERVSFLEKENKQLREAAEQGSSASGVKLQEQIELSNVSELGEIELRALVVRQEEEVRKLRQRNLKMVDRQSRLEDELEKLKQQYESAEKLQSENDSLKQQVQRLKSMNVEQFNENIEEQKKRAQDFEKEREELETQIDEIKRNKARLELEISSFEAKNQSLQENERELAAKIFSFDEQLSARETEHKLQIEEHKAQLAEAEERLKIQEDKIRGKELEYEAITKKIEQDLQRKHEQQIQELQEKLQQSRQLLSKQEQIQKLAKDEEEEDEKQQNNSAKIIKGTNFRETLANFEQTHSQQADSNTLELLQMMREEYEQLSQRNEELKNEVMTLQQLLSEFDFNYLAMQIISRAHDHVQAAGNTARAREQANFEARMMVANEIRYILSRIENIATDKGLKYQYLIEE